MLKSKNLLLSPSTPSAILLYGILFGFALWSYLGWQWQRTHTIALYGATAVWAIAVILHRCRSVSFSLNRLDLFFGAFLLLVLGSLAVHWPPRAINFLEFIPFFFILPYLLGRIMLAQDVELFKKILIGMGGALLLLMPIEYWRNSQPGFLYAEFPTPILFGQSHGVMLSGLLFSATLLTLISTLISPGSAGLVSRGHRWSYRFLGYLMLATIVSAMVWISSRGSLIAVGLGIIALFLLSPFFGWKKKSAILVYLSLFALVAFTISFQNKHHKEFYRQLFLRPSVVLSEVPGPPPQLEYGKPILGDSICKNTPGSISDRWIHYRTAWEIFLAKPLTGVGANSYGLYSCANRGQFPHTTVLQVLAELGVLGALLYFPMIWFMFRVPIKRYKSDPGMLFKSNMGWLLAFTVFQFTTSQFYGNYFMSTSLYFVMGLAAGYLNDRSRSVMVG